METIKILCPWCKGACLEIVPEFILSLDVILSTCPKCSFSWVTIPKSEMSEAELKMCGL